MGKWGNEQLAHVHETYGRGTSLENNCSVFFQLLTTGLNSVVITEFKLALGERQDETDVGVKVALRDEQTVQSNDPDMTCMGSKVRRAETREKAGHYTVSKETSMLYNRANFNM